MKKLLLTRPLALCAGILLVLPSLYFVVSALLNYGLGFAALWKLIEPIFNKPENKSLGFNINIVILFGPLVAILINLPQVVQLHFSRMEDEVYINLSISKYRYSWMVVAAGIGCLGIMFFYLVAENICC